MIKVVYSEVKPIAIAIVHYYACSKHLATFFEYFKSRIQFNVFQHFSAL